MKIKYAGYIIKELNYRLFLENANEKLNQERLNVSVQGKLSVNKDFNSAFVDFDGEIDTKLLNEETSQNFRKLELTVQFNFDIDWEEDKDNVTDNFKEEHANEIIEIMKNNSTRICEVQFKSIVKEITSIDYIGAIQLEDIEI